jgi:hypothetical protein
MQIGPGGFLDNLGAWLRRESQPRAPAKTLPFAGGWLVFLAYEMAQEVEPILQLPRAEGPYSAFALRVRHLAVFDHAQDAVFAISEDGDSATHADLVALLESAAQQPLSDSDENPHVDRWVEEPSNCTSSACAVPREYIAAGDIYQANPRAPWRLRLRAPAATRVRLPGAAAFEPCAVRSVRAVRRGHDPFVVARTAAAGRGPEHFDAAHRRNASPDRRPRPGSTRYRRTGGASQGTRRAHHAHRSRAQ